MVFTARRITFAGLVLAALVAVLAAEVAPGPVGPGLRARRIAASGTYEWWVADRGGGGPVSLRVFPVDLDDLSAYIAESDARLDAWIGDPGAAPALVDTFVTVTFDRPVSVAEFDAVLAPLPVVVIQHTAVGRDEAGGEMAEVGVGPPAAERFAGTGFDPAAGGAGRRFALDGVITADLMLEGGSTADLDVVRADTLVFFLDTTAIQVQRFDMVAADEASREVAEAGLYSPWPERAW